MLYLIASGNCSYKGGIIYVSDTLNHIIRKIMPDGTTTTITAASKRVVESHPGFVLPAGDYRNGSIQQALFNEPTGLALDEKGNLYVSDSGNQLIRYIDFSTNEVITVAGELHVKIIQSMISMNYMLLEVTRMGQHKQPPFTLPEVLL